MIKNFFKKIYIILLIFLFAVICFINITFAKNNVSNIDINVSINDDGSAKITQNWIGNFETGTEVYIPIEDLNLNIKNLKVSMDNKNFTSLDDWDINANFKNKSYKSGIYKTSKGVELCFGISKYGNNKYTFSYDISPLVRSYSDADGFNFQFINPNMDIFPTDINIKILLANGKKLSKENAKIWGFGFDGEIKFIDDGYVQAFTKKSLNYSNYVNIMLQINKGIIYPKVSAIESFEKLKKKAIENSSYEKKSDNENSILDYYLYVLCLIFISVLVIPLIIIIKREIDLKKFYKQVNYFRDVPNGGSIALTYTLFHNFDIWNSDENNVIAAIIMKMINDKNLIIMQDITYGFFKNKKVKTNLKIGDPPTDELNKKLYDLIIKAAGSDNILQEDELKKYAEKNYEEMNNYLYDLKDTGNRILEQKKCYKNLFSKNRLKDLTDVGKKELSEVYGLRKFLNEFTLISERDLTESIIWEDLMIYATLFGIAKKVLSRLKKLYPDKIVEIEKYTDIYYISDAYFKILYITSIHAQRTIKETEAEYEAASGFGGMTSFDGGGGFSSGGFGGGTR